MVKAGYGRIINIASILGKGGLPELPVADYATAKGGVINLTRQACRGVGNDRCDGQRAVPRLLPFAGKQPRGNGGDGWLHQGPARPWVALAARRAR